MLEQVEEIKSFKVIKSHTSQLDLLNHINEHFDKNHSIYCVYEFDDLINIANFHKHMQRKT